MGQIVRRRDGTGEVVMAKLSEEDIRKLLSEPTAARREDVARKVAAVHADGELSDSERRLAEDIFRLMLRDAEVRVRSALAEALKDNPGVPSDVARTLARDVVPVATPILEFSEVLTDEDLIEIVRAQTGAAQEAVARRKTISAELGDTIVRHGAEGAVATVVGNPGAELGEKTLLTAIDRFPASENVQAGVIARPVLPVKVSERLVSVVSDRLRTQLVKRPDVPAGLALDLALAGRERAVIGLVDPSRAEDPDELIDVLYAARRLTPTILFRALCIGDRGFFDRGISRLAGVALMNAQRLIDDPGRKGLERLLQTARIPDALAHAMMTAIDVAREMQYDGRPGDRIRCRSTLIERVLTQVEGIDSDNLDYLISRLASGDRAA
ncbi:ATP-dependent protease HslVU (ClpYQ), ATPase subunit (plasmid) [Tistrella mobilis KA081020-065]|uniref:ATP-dependent protease HslVU (ClpYQ), ATPase subunit n=2 Tax=Tistrella mobilis TaxID=171437 RepID=I3TXG8_TISMK|nr:ATP-dependent protease HslVU (ClpYQ), ATPase subunit [Tistrella mobilis KA081020-065]